MSQRSRQLRPLRRRGAPRTVDLDPVGLALSRVSKLIAEQRAPLERAATHAFEEFRAGRGTAELWADLADCLNVAEALAQADLVLLREPASAMADQTAGSPDLRLALPDQRPAWLELTLGQAAARARVLPAGMAG